MPGIPIGRWIVAAITPVPILRRLDQIAAGGQLPPPDPAQVQRTIIGEGLAAFTLPDWCALDAPAQARNWRMRAGGPGAGMARMFGLVNDAGNLRTVPDWFVLVWQGMPGPVGLAILATIYGFIYVYELLWGLFPGGADCSRPLRAMLALIGLLMGAWERWVGRISPALRMAFDTASIYACPTKTVDTPTALWALRANLIDRPDCSEWLRAQGWCDAARHYLMEQQYVELTQGELVQLWQRGKISREELESRLQRYGFRRTDVMRQWIELHERELSESQLITLYQRGSIQLGELYERMRWWGWTDHDRIDQLIELSWIPLGLGELADALHRLRPDAGRAGGPFTESDVATGLSRLGFRQDDHSLLIALMSRPPMHRMVVSGFEKGTIDEKILADALADEGMDPHYISALMDTYSRIRTHTLRAEMGAPGAAQLVKDAAAGKLTAADLSAELKLWGLTGDEIAAGAQEAQAQTLRDIRAAGITSVRAGYQTGQMSGLAAETDMRAFGLDTATVARLLNLWTLEAQAKRHPDSPATLCLWATKGVIEVREMRERLLLQGYTPLQVAHMVSACDLKAQERAQAIAAKDASAREKKAVQGVKAVESLVRRMQRAAAAHEKAVATAEVTTAREVLGELGREAHEIHAAEHAAETAAKPPAVRAAETMPSAAADQQPAPAGAAPPPDGGTP